MPGSLFLVATPIGNLEDITLRGLRVLREVDLIAAEDTRRTGRLLSHFGITTRTTSLHAHNESRRVPELLAQVAEGLRLAVVTDAGMPGVSDPGYLVVRHAIDAGLPLVVVPGVSALTTALAGSGLPSDEFCFLGFAPSRSAERKRWVADALGASSRTSVVFEAPGRVKGLLGDVLEELGDRQVVVAREMTKVHESWYRGWVSDFTGTDDGPIPERGECVVLLSNLTRPESTSVQAVSDAEVFSLFQSATDSASLSRRDAIAKVAGQLGLPKKAVYAIVERAKLSVE